MTKTREGYVLIFVGKNHNLAMANGQALEHRVVYQNHLGRKLLKTEIIHHINGKRDDNRIENLKLCKSNADHLFLHRKKFKQVLCRCGCGNYFNGRDEAYRKRVFIKGHRPLTKYKVKLPSWCNSECRQLRHYIRKRIASGGRYRPHGSRKVLLPRGKTKAV